MTRWAGAATRSRAQPALRRANPACGNARLRATSNLRRRA
jgi:hypothetical protein